MNKKKICHACRTEIDSRATVCPQCRSKQPRQTARVVVLVGLGLLVSTCMLNKVETSSKINATPQAKQLPKPQTAAVEKKDEPPPPPPTPAVGEEVSEKYFDYLVHEVSFDCSQEIKKHVKYDIRSPGVLYGTNTGMWAFLRFTRWSKYVASDGTIKIRGDDAEAQNGFGNWLKINYVCQIDVATKKIVYASFHDGRL